MTDTAKPDVRRSTLAVIVLTCGLSYMFDGYDLIVYGTTLPSLVEQWGISPAAAGSIGSYALVGMLIGALSVGSITDVFGRRRVLIVAVTWFSVLTALCAFAPNPEVFGVLRFLAGLGLGGVLPTLNALVIEYAPERSRNLTYVVMAVGYPLGGLLAASLAIPLIPALGWQVMYLIAAVPLVVVLPLAIWKLPESLESLVARGRLDEARALADRLGVDVPAAAGGTERARWGGVRTLFAPSYALPTVLFWIAAFCSLLLIYGLNTWLPQLMRQAGYPLGSALSFLLVFNAGAVLGLAFGGRAADRFGPRPVIGIGFALAAASVLLLITTDSMFGLYVLFAFGGYGTIGTQTLLNAYVTGFYPGTSRAAGIGWALGVGRLGGILGPVLGGLLLSAGASLPVVFATFAAVALAGAVVITAVRRRPAVVAAAVPA
ncbi:MFS transporter [Pseudonocardia sp. TRM90224]|uniref:MFS transporter n=1 Tax=Pseudonocardia sp. TRM90224 TaxID=2812678 RepID=UPI001E2A0EC4|nr:aromatic acid/H+ symport family MFS transporter [Pseudonocardia sp. TRM90224]